jgi:hypothetical protein
MPLLIVIQFLDEFIGKVPGFYVAFLFATAYLMVPLFQGADKIYRSVFVPVFGLHRELFLRDAMVMKRSLEERIPKETHSSFKKELADVFLTENYGQKDAKTSGDYASLT